MRYNLGAKVYTSDGQEIGTISRLVVDPRRDEVEEFVVEKGFFVSHDVIIPIGQVRDHIGNDDEHEIHLAMTAEDVKKLPQFEEVRYVGAPDDMYPGLLGSGLAPGAAGLGGGGWLWPASAYEPAQSPQSPTDAAADAPRSPFSTMDERVEDSRPGRAFLSTGTDVVAHGDKIGTVDELVVDERTGKVTELIVKKGLFGGKEIRIPTQFIESIGDDAVHVALDQSRLERFTVSDR